MLEALFIVSVLLIIHAYFGYPVSLYFLAKWKGKTFKYTPSDGYFCPTVSIIIAAHNEEKGIANKLKNTMSLAYPNWYQVQVIIASDASTDMTDSIVHNMSKLDYPSRNIKVVRNKVNGGKEAAQKLALEHATGEICVFTDVATSLEPNALYTLICNFYDKRVGAVDGMSVVVNDDGSEGGEGAYLKYENAIRKLESRLGSTVSLGGSLFAARTELLQKDFSPSLQSDFRTALMSVTHRYQAIIDPEAKAKFKDTKDPSKESARKHRTVVRGINNLMHHLYLLNPFKYGIFSYQLFCHKLLKWLVPFCMIAAFVTNLILAVGSDFWLLMWIGQITFYVLAALEIESNKILKLVSFFVMSNAAILNAWWSYIKGERFVSWKPTVR